MLASVLIKLLLDGITEEGDAQVAFSVTPIGRFDPVVCVIQDGTELQYLLTRTSNAFGIVLTELTVELE